MEKEMLKEKKMMVSIIFILMIMHFISTSILCNIWGVGMLSTQLIFILISGEFYYYMYKGRYWARDFTVAFLIFCIWGSIDNAHRAIGSNLPVFIYMLFQAIVFGIISILLFFSVQYRAYFKYYDSNSRI